MAQHPFNVGFLDHPGLVQHLWTKAPEGCGNYGWDPARHLLHRDGHHIGYDGAQEYR